MGPNLILHVHTWLMIHEICPEKFTFISSAVSEMCLIMLLFDSILVVNLPIRQPKTYTGCEHLAHNLRNIPQKIHFYVSIHFWDMPLYATFSYHIWSNTGQSVGQKLILGVCTQLIIQGIYPKNFTFISPVISDMCLIMLFFMAYPVIYLPISQPKTYTGCVHFAHNSGNILWKIHFYISSHFWAMPHYATFYSISGFKLGNKSAQN